MKARSVHKASITEDEFKKIHEMVKIGLTTGQIAKFTGWSTGAVTLWKKYPTWDAYCEHKKSLLLPNKPSGGGIEWSAGGSPGGGKAPVTVVEVLQELTVEVRKLREAWESSPTNRTGFWSKLA